MKIGINCDLPIPVHFLNYQSNKRVSSWLFTKLDDNEQQFHETSSNLNPLINAKILALFTGPWQVLETVHSSTKVTHLRNQMRNMMRRNQSMSR